MFTTFIYDGSFNGLISAVYDAYYSKLPVEEVRFIEDFTNAQKSSDKVYGDDGMNVDIVNSPTLFDNEVVTETSEDKSEKVLSALINKTSYDVYHDIYMVYLSYYPQKGDLIFKYIKLCFSMGRRVFSYISHPVIADVNRISRRVSMEKHKLLGFVRFQELQNGVFYSRITPENNQLELIAPHFADRMKNENWIIYDTKRQLACVHNRGGKFYITDDIPEIIRYDKVDEMNTIEEERYRVLWKAFFEIIGIKERYNPRCQMNMMPKRYWDNMIEVKDKLKGKK